MLVCYTRKDTCLFGFAAWMDGNLTIKNKRK